MNVFKTFEQRMNSIFGAAPQGFTAPISLRKLARRAAREMEAETFVVDGVNTAPALYTILVSSADDATMRALYPQFIAELSDLVEQEGKRHNYVFVGKPLARFMVDPSLRSGRFAVFAENVDVRTLNRLRIEEEAFLSGASTLGGATSAAASAVEIPRSKKRQKRAILKQPVEAPMAVPEPQTHEDDAITPAPAVKPAPVVIPTPVAAPVPVALSEPEPAAEPASPLVSRVPGIASEHMRAIPVPDPVAIPISGSPLTDDSIGLGVIPTDYVDSQYADALAPSPAPTARPVSIPVTQRRPQAQPAPAATPATAPVSQSEQNYTCTLIDHQSGRSYIASAPSAIIGRERSEGAVVLRDPNVSRRHAQISWDGRGWRIKDLHSTNGTLVNDVDITECALHDGDLITVGLMNLEFREN